MLYDKLLSSLMKKWYLKSGLKELARHRFMTLPELEEVTGVTRATFHRYKTDPEVKPHPFKIRKI